MGKHEKKKGRKNLKETIVLATAIIELFKALIEITKGLTE